VFGTIFIAPTTKAWNGEGAHLFPGAVMSQDCAIAYVPEATGGVEAVFVSNGKSLWSTHQAVWPLELLNDRLVAAAPVPGKPHAFQIDCIDVQTGTVRTTSDAISLPDWVTPSWTYDEQPGYQFDLSSECFDNHIVVCRWCARNWVKSQHEKASGTFQVDTQTGDVSTPFLGAQPSVYRRNLLYDNGSDPVLPGNRIVGPDFRLNGYTLYLSRKSAAVNGKSPLAIVAVDSDTQKLIWQKPLGCRSVKAQA